MDKKKAIKLHRELWNWLFHHPSKRKADWPRWKYNNGDISRVPQDCFACEYDHCGECLFVWGPNDGDSCEKLVGKGGWFLEDEPGYFSRWEDAKTAKTRKKYAKIIRDLPVREE